MMRASAALAVLLVIAQPNDVASGSQPNALMIAIDDLPPEMRCYGSAHIHSPNIDRPASRGMDFEEAFCRHAVSNLQRIPVAKLLDKTLSRNTLAANTLHLSGPTTPVQSTSFEGVTPGAFTSLDVGPGRWVADKEHAEIDDRHARTGRQCLRILGGDHRIVELIPAANDLPADRLIFSAERWTRRKPFSFRIERKTGRQWQEIYNGDATIRVGGFLTHVTVALKGPHTDRLRLICTSPAGSGLLIDDLSLSAANPKAVKAVTAENYRVPVLVGAPASPLLRIRVDVDGSRGDLALTSLRATLTGSVKPKALNSLTVYYTAAQDTLRAAGSPNCFAGAAQLGKPCTPQIDLQFRGRQELAEGVNYFWIAGTLSASADIDAALGAVCLDATFSDGTTRPAATPEPLKPLRLGVAVRRQGDDNSHTYRIPGLARTNAGTLIGVYDIRRGRGGDLPGDIDVGMSRSTDGGRTWEPMQVIMDMGDDPNWKHDGIGDPAVLVDRETGAVWVAAVWSHGNRAWNGSQPGMKPAETGQLILVRSDDDGRTWSEPINITKQIKKPEWCYLLQGPGKGITLRDGTLVFAAQYQDTLEKKRLPRSTIIYSRDHGKTWQIGTGACDDTTESQVVELEPGLLMLNCRYNRESARVVMTTRDMGKSWQIHPTSRRALREPRACMASLIDVDQECGKDIGGILLFSNPDSVRTREHITIKASMDRGKTWPRKLLIDAGSSAGYSCMAMIDEKTVGILYEGSQAHMTFQRIPLQDILQNPPPPIRSKSPLGHSDKGNKERIGGGGPNVLLIVSESTKTP